LFFSIIRKLKRISRLKTASYISWFGINNLGCTWEQKNNFFGTAADLKLQEYIKLKEEEATKAGKRREDILAGKLGVTSKYYELPAAIEPPTAPTAPTAPIASTCQRPDSQSHRSRQNASNGWDHFNGGPGNPEKWYWDNSTTPASKRSNCNLCNVHVTASSTTNLRTHMK